MQRCKINRTRHNRTALIATLQHRLERITYAKIQAQGVKCRRYIVIRFDRLRGVGRPLFGVFEGLVRRMNAYAQIQTHYQAVYIQTQAGSCT